MKIGSFMIESGKIIICDPCYDDALHMHIVTPALNGQWEAYVEKIDGRISKLYATLEGTSEIQLKKHKKHAGVDSGQMGIYDARHFMNENSVEPPLQDFGESSYARWYLMCCNRTLNDVGAGLIPHGVVSSSGWGDGRYPVRVSEHDGKVNHIEITFIEDEEEY